MKRLVKAALPPAVLFVIVIAAWHYLVVGFGSRNALMPKPTTK